MSYYTEDTDLGVYYYQFKNRIPIQIILNLKEDYTDKVFFILRTDAFTDENLHSIRLFCYRINSGATNINNIFNNVRCGFNAFYIDWN